MNHDTLGELTSDPNTPFDLVGTVLVGETEVRLSIDFDGDDKDQVLAFASDIAAQVDRIVSIASQFASEKLLDTYNENWRHYCKSDSNGVSVEVTDPLLDSDGFSRNLRIGGVSICGHTNCEIWFSDGGMFAGHSVFVTSFDGTKFEDLHADLFG